jgi:hypothetical protein
MSCRVLTFLSLFLQVAMDEISLLRRCDAARKGLLRRTPPHERGAQAHAAQDGGAGDAVVRLREYFLYRGPHGKQVRARTPAVIHGYLQRIQIAKRCPDRAKR